MAEHRPPHGGVDHALPRDVGVMVGLPWAELGYRGFPDD
jgi:hypothetical protein